MLLFLISVMCRMYGFLRFNASLLASCQALVTKTMNEQSMELLKFPTKMSADAVSPTNAMRKTEAPEVSKSSPRTVTLVRNPEVYRAVKASQQFIFPFGSKKLGRVHYIVVLAGLLVGPMLWTSFSFFLSFTLPIDEIAYFDGCTAQKAVPCGEVAAVNWTLNYQDCLSCNRGIPYVSTKQSHYQGIAAPTFGASIALGIVAIFSFF